MPVPECMLPSHSRIESLPVQPGGQPPRKPKSTMTLVMDPSPVDVPGFMLCEVDLNRYRISRAFSSHLTPCPHEADILHLVSSPYRLTAHSISFHRKLLSGDLGCL